MCVLVGKPPIEFLIPGLRFDVRLLTKMNRVLHDFFGPSGEPHVINKAKSIFAKGWLIDCNRTGLTAMSVITNKATKSKSKFI